MILHLGVIDIPYAAPSFAEPKSPKVVLGRAKRGKASAPRASAGKTTGDVAEIIEHRYHVQELFFELHRDRIAETLEQSLAGELENMLIGAPPGTSTLGEATSSIEAMFKQFLASGGLNGIEPGVPTQAALLGVSHRFKHPYAQRGQRPSFIDTGLYQANFHVWMD